MPYRRRNADKAKQNKALTTRLMEISLKLDDYVYNKKPISAADANAYIREISTYKMKCLEDERSLQVVEKLTRCMKAIIREEQHEDVDEKMQETSLLIIDTSIKTTAYCPSPTYSEDMEHVVNNEQTQDIIQPNAAKANSEKVTIDLCAEEDFERDHTEFNINVKMHRAISNLSITDMQDPLKTTNGCSQSILDNITHESFIPNTKKTKGNNDEITSTIIDKSTKINKNYIDLTEEEDKLPKKREMKEVVRFETNIYKSHDVTVLAVPKNHNKNISKNTTRKKNCSLKGKLNNQSNVKTKNKSKKQVNKKIKTPKQNNRIMEDTSAKIKKRSAKVNDRNSITSNKIDKSFDANTILGGTYNKSISYSNNVQQAKNCSISKIYSNNTENDLSWVENIRFVREIQKEEEVDVKLSGLSDSFWGDLSIPTDWDEREFDVY